MGFHCSASLHPAQREIHHCTHSPATGPHTAVRGGGGCIVLVLTQEEDGKLHPCAFYSRRLSSTDCNYDIGDRELLAIKLALEEWRHWLKGAAQLFIVWTDHKNLEYLRSARHLNSWQARWALFFTRFDFTITYRLGSRNVKPDALSRQFSVCLGRNRTPDPFSRPPV